MKTLTLTILQVVIAFGPLFLAFASKKRWEEKPVPGKEAFEWTLSAFVIGVAVGTIGFILERCKHL